MGFRGEWRHGMEIPRTRPPLQPQTSGSSLLGLDSPAGGRPPT
jgi:hypothetical protein